tara:strand:+ start:8629 stop:10224 length:1596 start_codon:yes stop_codon:yes gene_type:complete
MINVWKARAEDIPCVCSINTFNNELTIYACLQQAVKNFGPSYTYVFDDGSTDKTIEYIQKFNNDHNVNIQILPVGDWDPWPDQKVPRDHGPGKGTLIEAGKTHAKSKFKSWWITKSNFPDAIYFSLEADVILADDALVRARKRIAEWKDPAKECEFFNVVFTIDSDYVRPMCTSEDSLDDRLEGITQRKVYDQPGDWTFACLWTGGDILIGPDPIWPYGACTLPWDEKIQAEKKGQDVDIPYGFHLYNYNNNNLTNNFQNRLILKMEDLDDDEVDWSILKRVWFPKTFFIDNNLQRQIVESNKMVTRINGINCFDTNSPLVFHGSIAVVGNSGCLLKKEYGDLIDSHETVVRFNNANISDYVQSTGKKTTDLVINCHVYNNADLKAEGFSEWKSNEDVFSKHDDDVRILYVNTNPISSGRDPIPKEKKFYVLNSRSFHELQNLVLEGITEEKEKIKHELNLPAIPTVGHALVLNLIRSGLKPNLFGFTIEPEAEWDHYFEKRPAPSESHAHSAEISNLLLLEKHGLIKIYT